MKVAFLVQDLALAGGTGVIVEHARRLHDEHGHDVRLVLLRDAEEKTWSYDALAGLRVQSLEEARAQSVDVAVATWWETTHHLFGLPARRYAYFVQSLEDRFYMPDEADRIGAALTLDLPVHFITEARWIAETLERLRPDARCYLVRNGIDKEVFAPPESVRPRTEGPLRIVIEGHPQVWFKHVHTAIAATQAMEGNRHVTVVTGDREGLGDVPVDRVLGPLSHREMAGLYAESDVVLKLSSVEGMFGPPLEGFHMGATCVVTPVTGHDEYVEHRWNGWVCDWDDLRGTARALDLLDRDRRLLHFLRHNALETARAWPSWRQSGQFMAAALQAIADGPPPPPRAGVERLLADVRGHVEWQRTLLQERAEYKQRAQPVMRLMRHPIAYRLKRARGRRSVQVLLRPVRPLYRRLRRTLLGR